jgi:hypothetical protein
MSGKKDTNTEAFVMHRRAMYESDAWKSLGKVRISSMRNPHHYRLTYIATYDENGNRIAPTDEWKKYRAGSAARNKTPDTKTYPVPVTKTYPVPGTKTYLCSRWSPVTKTYLLSIIYPYLPVRWRTRTD